MIFSKRPDTAMIAFFFKKTVILILVMAVISVAIFAVLFVLPGDPAQLMLGIHATADTLAQLRAQLGLDLPFWTQYGRWISGWWSGQPTMSIHYGVSVASLIAERMMVTVPLALLAILITVGAALPLGIFAARRCRQSGDWLVMGISQVGLAVPEFWLGIVLMLVFAVTWHIFPAGGFPGWSGHFWPALRALVLPATALAAIRAAILARITRSAVLEVLGKDYIRTARAKGLSGRAVVYGHALRNAAGPVLTIAGLQLGQLLAGAIIIENVFHLPGVGQLVLQAIGQRDLPVIREVVLIMALAVVVVNWCVDLAHGAIDPRVRLQ